MKKAIVLLVVLFSSTLAIADCSAPDLALEKHDGNVLGFKVLKLWDDSKGRNIDKNYDTLIKFVDYDFLISAKDKGRKPTKLNIETTNISKMLLDKFKTSTHHQTPKEQTFTVSGIEAYDLSGDSKENLLLFNVSPGANVYSGAIGIVNGEWKTLVEPTCF